MRISCGGSASTATRSSGGSARAGCTSSTAASTRSATVASAARAATAPRCGSQPPAPSSEIDVTVRSDRRGDATVEIHRDRLDPSETLLRNGIRVTKPLRTLLDLASCVSDKELERAIRQAIYRRLTTTTRLAEAVHKREGSRGAKRMRKALRNIGEAPGLIRSDLEHDFHAFLRKHKLPLPELNTKLRIHNQRIEVDCLWRSKRLIVELDGAAKRLASELRALLA